MKKLYALFFLLGMITYLALPKDYAVADPTTGSQDQAEVIATEDNGCIVYQEIHAVGKDLMPVIKIACGGEK